MLDSIRQRWPELERLQTEATDTSKVKPRSARSRQPLGGLIWRSSSFLPSFVPFFFHNICHICLLDTAGVQSARVQRSSGLHHIHVRALLRLLQPAAGHCGRQPEGGVAGQWFAQHSPEQRPEPLPVYCFLFPACPPPKRCVFSGTPRCLCGMRCVQERQRRSCCKSSALLWAERRNSMQVCVRVHVLSLPPGLVPVNLQC